MFLKLCIYFKSWSDEYIKWLIINTVCYNFILNTNKLSIINTKVSQSQMNEEYNPNDLHSKTIISQYGIEPVLYIYNGHFIGSYYGIYLASGSAKIINCSLQQSLRAIYTEKHDEFIMRYCEINMMNFHENP